MKPLHGFLLAFFVFFHTACVPHENDRSVHKLKEESYFTFICMEGVTYIHYHFTNAAAMSVMYNPDGTVKKCQDKDAPAKGASEGVKL